tara:strand:- start:10 stop:219 length:210 start_codon:yes stop_codon:yes gene_type:complete
MAHTPQHKKEQDKKKKKKASQARSVSGSGMKKRVASRVGGVRSNRTVTGRKARIRSRGGGLSGGGGRRP